jgi:hypothetical protein
VAERFKAAVLKTVDRKVPGFESLPLRHDSEREMADPAKQLIHLTTHWQLRGSFAE